jgi:hypothetical protein
MLGRDKVELDRFPIDRVLPNRIWLILGRRGTGKSILLLDLLSHMHRSFDYGVAFTPTEESAQMFATIMPAASIYGNFDPMVVERIMAHQRAESKAGHQLRSIFVILDDCLYDRAVLRHRAVRDLFLNGRHQRVTCLMCAQYLMDISPDLRTQIDYSLCLKDNIMQNRMKLYKSLFGMFPTYDAFAEVMTATTENHGAIVLDQTAPGNSVRDNVFWYRAIHPPPHCFLGRRTFYRLSAQHQMTPDQQAVAARRGAQSGPHGGLVTLLGRESPKRPDEDSPREERRDRSRHRSRHH